MNIETLQTDIRDQILTQVTTDMAVTLVMPEDDGGMSRPKDQKAKVVVGYQQSEYTDVNVIGGVSQIEKPLIIVTIQSRSLYGDNGIFPIFKLIKKAVIGFTPQDCERPLVAKYFGPPEAYTKPRQDEVWTWEYHIETRCPSIQELDDNDIVASLMPFSAELIVPAPGTLLGDEVVLQGPGALIEFIEG